MVSSDASWFDLHRYVSSLRQEHPRRKIWEDIHCPTQSDLDALVLEGWRVWPKRDPLWTLTGALSPEKKKLYYKEGLGYKKRDITICHELAHLFYPAARYARAFSQEDWESVIEWTGRSWRRKAPVLKIILESFHVPTKIYDSVTRNAFPEQRRQRLSQDYGYEQIPIPF